MKTKTKFFCGGVLALALGLGAIGVVGNLSQAQEVGATETTTTYAYGDNPKFGGFTFSSFTDKDTYYLVPADASCLISKTGVLGSSGLNVDKTQQIVITINHATYGSGDNPSASTFSFYNNTTGTGTAVVATAGETYATSKTFVDATYTFAANAFSGDDLCIKVTKPGKQIRFKSFAIKFTASTAPAKTFTSLAVSGAPTKTSYVNGNTFDPTGLVVTASFDDSSTENVSSDTVWTPAPLSTGTTSVTGTYSHGGVTKTVACSGLTVVAESLVSMKITTAAQTEYATGDALDLSALVVTGTYDNGTTKVITSECTCSPANGSILSVGETTVTVSHAGVTSLNFVVTAAAVTRYMLISDVSLLAPGMKVVIAASGYDVMMSSTQNSNNRAQADAKKNTTDGTVGATSGYQEFILGKGATNSDYFTFNAGNETTPSYLYAASSSSNYLRSEETLDSNGEWAITIADGVASISAEGATNSNHFMRYNSTSSIFSCYGSATSQKDLALYVLQEADSWAKGCLAATAAPCASDASGTVASDSLKTAWASLNTLYGELDETSKAAVKTCDKSGTASLDLAAARYDYILAKYGVASFTAGNFAQRELSSSAGSINRLASSDTLPIVIVSSLALLGLLTTAGVFLLKKKHQ